MQQINFETFCISSILTCVSLSSLRMLTLCDFDWISWPKVDVGLVQVSSWRTVCDLTQVCASINKDAAFTRKTLKTGTSWCAVVFSFFSIPLYLFLGAILHFNKNSKLFITSVSSFFKNPCRIQTSDTSDYVFIYWSVYKGFCGFFFFFCIVHSLSLVID